MLPAGNNFQAPQTYQPEFYLIFNNIQLELKELLII